MSAPISHIVFAEKILKRLPRTVSLREFYVGVCFPDIRYLGGIAKENTHPKTTNFKDIYDRSAFVTGMKCHVYLDKLRERYLNNLDAYASFADFKFAKMGVKFYEDRLRLIDFSQRRINSYLNSHLPEEIEFGLSGTTVDHWHLLLKQYLSSKVANLDIKNLLQNFEISTDAASEINDVITYAPRDKELTETLNRFYREFDALLDLEINGNL